MKYDKGQFVCKRQFNGFDEDKLNLPSNIHKFLQSTENDDDVETDDETLKYYINKVRKQLEESVEAERLRKKMVVEELDRIKKLEEKENIKHQKEKEVHKHEPNFNLEAKVNSNRKDEKMKK